ncbi:MAG: hypothetical protein OXI87_11200 [Albidovulum sp.]|nr:hypothetical protein [Albidovulum sp.]MDE0305426.1 hypothetical protein [Albidovulum sp.]
MQTAVLVCNLVVFELYVRHIRYMLLVEQIFLKIVQTVRSI